MKPGFVREVYLRATPSIDLDLVTEEKSVDCCKYTMKISVYEDLLNEFCENKEERMSANMFMLMNGPQLVED